jgi:hypothetical protein
MVSIDEEMLSDALKRTRAQLSECEASNAAKNNYIVRLTLQKRELMAALDRAAPAKAKELAEKFARESD